MSDAYILIIEDETKIAAVLRDYLKNAGYRVSCMDRGDTVVAFVKKESPSLILLDIMLPGMDGTEVCREIRKFSTVPVIMITAKVEEIDRLIGLEIGADDYICKPFSPREVVARVKAVLRRSSPQVSGKILIFGQIRLDEDLHQTSINDTVLELTPSEYKLLNVMIRHPGRVFSRNELINRVQGYEFEGYERTIDSHIKNLRKKIAELLPEQEIVKSVYGVGYQLAAGKE